MIDLVLLNFVEPLSYIGLRPTPAAHCRNLHFIRVVLYWETTMR
jgi:hypothetical protein